MRGGSQDRYLRTGTRPSSTSGKPWEGAELPSEDSDYASKLISALDHPEPETPVRAAWILGELRETRAVGALVGLLEKGRDPYILAGAAEALGKIGDARATGVLAKALASSYLLVRLKAVEALGRLGGDEARRALESALEDPNPSARKAAAKTLQRLDREVRLSAREETSHSNPAS